MDFGTIIGIVIGFAGIVAGYILEEGVISALWQKSAFFIVFGGTIGAVVISFPLFELAKLPKALKIVFTNKKYDEISIINQLSSLSEKARKEGLLSLEKEVELCENDFMKKGMSLVVDGIEPGVIKDILEREISLYESIYESAAKIFESAGGFAPTMGVVGTVMGMVSILGSMEEEPGSLGGKIATAFIATLYGVSSANLLWLPFAGKIKAKFEKDKMVNEIIIEGLLSIQAGESSRIIKEKLNLALLEKLNGRGKSAGSAQEAEV